MKKWRKFKTENGELWEISTTGTGLRKVKVFKKRKPIKKKRNYTMQRAFGEMKRMNKELDSILNRN